MSFHVILYRPQIPPNTGNIIRLCANTGCTLHLVRPLGFDLNLKQVRRAELDYGDLARVRIHAGFDQCLDTLPDSRLFAIETSGAARYSDAQFASSDALLFGTEHRGLPADVLERVRPERRLSIPMQAGNRSLNLANAVAVVVYEAWRQQSFAGHAPRSTPSPP